MRTGNLPYLSPRPPIKKEPVITPAIRIDCVLCAMVTLAPQVMFHYKINERVTLVTNVYVIVYQSLFVIA